jgi:hypothetical protein
MEPVFTDIDQLAIPRQNGTMMNHPLQRMTAFGLWFLLMATTSFEVFATQEKTDTQPPDPSPPSPPATAPIDTVAPVQAEPTNQAIAEDPPKAPERRELPNLGSLMNDRIPGQPWRIHDATRPRPKPLQPATQANLPPADAVILFDGTGLDQWCHRSQDTLYEADWKIVDGALEVRPGAGNLYTLDGFGSCHLHIEYRIPAEVKGTSQNRGNSGIKLMERFEVQVLDSFQNRTYADGQAGAIYGQYPPMVNASLPPGEWQVYEIFFSAPLFEKEKLVRPAFLTVMHNGLLIHYHRELPGPTGARLPIYNPLTPSAPIMLQDHGSPVQYRNIWIRELDLLK